MGNPSGGLSTAPGDRVAARSAAHCRAGVAPGPSPGGQRDDIWNGFRL